MNVFTYGSLMFPAVWTRVVRGNYRAISATVHGFKRARIRNKEHPALIVASRAKPVEGRLYFDVSAGDIARLDHFETIHYTRVVIATTVAERAVLAQAYLALNLDSLLNDEWSATEFEQHGLSCFLATYAILNAPPD